MTNPLTNDTRHAPYWWDKAPPRQMRGELPTTVDVVIVGSGITGLSAALVLARTGKQVLVLDRDLIGSGAARRSAGYLGRNIKYSFRQMLKDLGPERARAVYLEVMESLVEIKNFIKQESIECYLEETPRLIAANSHEHLRLLKEDYEILNKNLGFPYEILTKDQISREIDARHYMGALVLPSIGALHPGLYHEGLLTRATDAGAHVLSEVEVQSIDQSNDGVSISTNRGEIRAAHAVLATNGYTTPHMKWPFKRMIPFKGFMAATEEVDPEQLKRLLPNRAATYDARVNIDFVRPAPDASKLLFGGGTGSLSGSLHDVARSLQNVLGRVFPELSSIRFSHLWTGMCAGTYDMMPHIGRRGRIWYGMGYNFAGITMGTHFGRKIAKQIIGDPDGYSEFEQFKFKKIPFIGGATWPMPWIVKYFDWKDDRIAKKDVVRS